MKHGIIIRNITDLRSHPRFQSERKSQLAYNEPVTIGTTKNDYCHVYQDDGYHGWVDRRALLPMTRQRWRKYAKSLSHKVSSKTASISNREDNPNVPPFLFYSTSVNIVRKDKRYATIVSPDGGHFRLLLSKLRPISDIVKRPADTSRIIRHGRNFLGVPYLWGGKTAFGIDCSGLVQLLFAMEGVNLPRDSGDQLHYGVKIEPQDISRGDLLFFKGHVAIAINRHKIIHSSLAEGGVAINSLKPGESDFRPDLADSFICARRVIK